MNTLAEIAGRIEKESAIASIKAFIPLTLLIYRGDDYISRARSIQIIRLSKAMAAARCQQTRDDRGVQFLKPPRGKGYFSTCLVGWFVKVEMNTDL